MTEREGQCKCAGYSSEQELRQKRYKIKIVLLCFQKIHNRIKQLQASSNTATMHKLGVFLKISVFMSIESNRWKVT